MNRHRITHDEDDADPIRNDAVSSNDDDTDLILRYTVDDTDNTTNNNTKNSNEEIASKPIAKDENNTLLRYTVDDNNESIVRYTVNENENAKDKDNNSSISGSNNGMAKRHATEGQQPHHEPRPTQIDPMKKSPPSPTVVDPPAVGIPNATTPAALYRRPPPANVVIQDHTHSHTISSRIPPTELRPYDVLCGRDKKTFNYIGNRRFRISIAINIPRYEQARSKVQKASVIRFICHDVLQNSVGVRFLKKMTTPGTSDGTAELLEEDKGPPHYHYIELNGAEARKKVGHALRDMSVARLQLHKKRNLSVAMRNKNNNYYVLEQLRQQQNANIKIANDMRSFQVQHGNFEQLNPNTYSMNKNHRVTFNVREDNNHNNEAEVYIGSEESHEAESRTKEVFALRDTSAATVQPRAKRKSSTTPGTSIDNHYTKRVRQKYQQNEESIIGNQLLPCEGHIEHDTWQRQQNHPQQQNEKRTSDNEMITFKVHEGNDDTTSQHRIPQQKENMVLGNPMRMSGGSSSSINNDAQRPQQQNYHQNDHSDIGSEKGGVATTITNIRPQPGHHKEVTSTHVAKVTDTSETITEQSICEEGAAIDGNAINDPSHRIRITQQQQQQRRQSFAAAARDDVTNSRLIGFDQEQERYHHQYHQLQQQFDQLRNEERQLLYEHHRYQQQRQQQNSLMYSLQPQQQQQQQHSLIQVPQPRRQRPRQRQQQQQQQQQQQPYQQYKEDGDKIVTKRNRENDNL